ncbi:MAG: hypothetical protein H6721_05170 [Sandaracinus sp.]|nr:hypothetical protein [Sandaracinus sp.]MCB9631520.1 hypothetical protein [Sandaracinus sp.]
MSGTAPETARKLARAVALAGALLAVLVARVLVGAHGELRRGDALRMDDDLDAAIVHYRRAAKWYAPGNPWSTEALEALRTLGATAEAEGETERALSAWRGVRGAILSTRSFYVPHPERLAEADAHLADLMASLPPPPIDADKSVEQRRAEHLALLRDVPRPHLGWTLLALLGFAAWVGGAFLFASRAFDEHDRFVAAPGRRFAAVFLLGVVAFVIGLRFA